MKTSPQPTILMIGLFSLFMIGYILLNDFFMQLISLVDLISVFLFIAACYIFFWFRSTSRWFPFQDKKGSLCSCPDCLVEITNEKDQAMELMQKSFFASSTIFESYCLRCKKVLVPRLFLVYIFVGWSALFSALHRFIFELSLSSFQEQDVQIVSVFIGVSLFWSIVLWYQAFPKVESQPNLK